MTSFRSVAKIANGFLHRDGLDALKPTTIKDRTKSVGNSIAKEIQIKAHEILVNHEMETENGIVSDTSKLPHSAIYPNLPGTLNMNSADTIIKTYNDGRSEREKIKLTDKVSAVETSSDGCCYISIDDIGVKHQKEERERLKVKERKYVENTVIHIQSGECKYYITMIGMRESFKALMAFLLENKLLENRRLIFLTDGARNIKSYIQEFFAFREYTIILDWLHLKKKCKELLSMSVKGKDKEEKQQILKDLLRILWVGNTNEAKKYLGNLKPKNIKNQSILNKTIEYIARKESDVPCYALRHITGLRTSSNRVEKANDLIVAQRQKHNGMSWSVMGSGALAAITAANMNGKLEFWIRGHGISFKMVA